MKLKRRAKTTSLNTKQNLQYLIVDSRKNISIKSSLNFNEDERRDKVTKTKSGNNEIQNQILVRTVALIIIVKKLHECK